jgi:hypothetical protein
MTRTAADHTGMIFLGNLSQLGFLLWQGGMCMMIGEAGVKLVVP